MDRLSGLSDELLVKILSFLPTKVAVSTSILSKRWEFLWMWLPKLLYCTKYYSETDQSKSIRRFLNRNLPLHRAPVIESFSLQFRSPKLKPEDIKLWVQIVVSRYVRELNISHGTYQKKSNILPGSLYICKTLVTLKLKRNILVDVPRMVCLPCLKTLRLKEVIYFSEDSLHRLLSNCPVLEDLLVRGCDCQFEDDNLRKFIVIVPSLKRLTVDSVSDLDEFVMNTPCLEYLKLSYYNSKSHKYCLIEDMPKLSDAYVEVNFPYIEKLIGAITSVKCLTLCLGVYNSEAVYSDGLVFKELVYLKLCTCKEDDVLDLLVWLLEVSPNLGVLDLIMIENHEVDGELIWNQPSTVPKCLLSSLQTFKFWEYLGRPEERDLVTYILQNACCLKTATILSQEDSFKPFDMIQELALSSRASTACQLVFK